MNIDSSGTPVSRVDPIKAIFHPEGERCSVTTTHTQRERAQVFCFQSVDVLEGDSSVFVGVRGRDETDDTVFTAGTGEQQPKSCRIHPDWDSNGSPSPGSILHDNDVVTFGEGDRARGCVCFATIIAPHTSNFSPLHPVSGTRSNIYSFTSHLAVVLLL